MTAPAAAARSAALAGRVTAGGARRPALASRPFYCAAASAASRAASQ